MIATFTIADAMRQAVSRLEKNGLEEARVEVEFFMAERLKTDRLKLPFVSRQPMSEETSDQLDRFVAGRAQRIPFAYLVGHQPFRDLDLTVNSNVLIPRPETEVWIDDALAFLNDRPSAVVVDVGTGSGAIALSLVRHPNVETAFGVDISDGALLTARLNEKQNPSPKTVQWSKSDLLNCFEKTPVRFDAVVANLPYIAPEEWPSLSPEVQQEPRLALDGGVNGLAVIERLAAQAKYFMREGGRLFLEIGWTQGERVCAILNREGWSNPVCRQDSAGHPRVVTAEWVNTCIS